MVKIMSRMKGEWLDADALPEKLFGRLVNVYEGNYGLVFVVQTNDRGLVNVNENRESLTNMLLLGYTDTDDFIDRPVYFRKEKWESTYSGKTGNHLVLYQIDKDKVTEGK